jgi:hypothetical protein
MKSAFALFESEQSANEAIEKLKESEVDASKAQIHSQATIRNSTSINAVPGGTGAATGVGYAAAPGAAATGTGAGGAFLSDENVRSHLEKIGVPGDQQAFFAHGVREGGYLVQVFDTGTNTEQAEQVLREAGGKASQSE